MPTALDKSPEDLDNPLAPHVQRRQQIQSEALLNLARQHAEGQKIQDEGQLRQQEEQLRQQEIHRGQQVGEVAQISQPAAIAQAKSQAQLPIEMKDFLGGWMAPQNFHKEGTDPSSPYETGNPYRVQFAQAPEEAKQNVISRYGPDGVTAWNEAAKQIGGTTNRALPLVMAKAGIKDDPSYTDEERQALIAGHAQDIQDGKGDKITAGTQKEFEDRRLPTLDEEGKPLTESAAVQKLKEFDKSSGRMSDADSQVYNQELQRYTQGREYTNAYTSANAMANFKSTFEDAEKNPNTANNLAVIDNFIRTQNPGATVRAQTLAMVKNGQALLQRLTPDYLAGHFEEGQMLTNQFVKEASKVIEDEAKAQNRLFKRTYLNGIHSALDKRGLPTDDFKSPYDSVLEGKGDESETPSTDFKTEADAEAAAKSGKLKDGDKITVGGLPATWHD